MSTQRPAKILSLGEAIDRLLGLDETNELALHPACTSEAWQELEEILGYLREYRTAERE